ncbi:MAG: HEAT repeat domain-containing protein, partial [Planctomycetota bacterium]
QLLTHTDASFRAWGVRAAGNFHEVEPALVSKIAELAQDPAADVKLQVAIAARKVKGLEPLPLLVKVLAQAGDDPIIPQVVWQNLHPLLETNSDGFLAIVKQYDLKQTPNLTKILPRATERILAAKKKESSK